VRKQSALEEGNKRRYEGKRNTEITQQVGTRGNYDGRTYKYLQKGERFVLRKEG
jgi:hypothetical protein